MVHDSNSNPYNDSQLLEDPDLEEAKALINLDAQKSLQNRIQQLTHDTFGGHFDEDKIDKYISELQSQLEGLEDMTFNCLFRDNIGG